MKLRMAFLIGLVVALGVTPGCRRKKAAVLATPWLTLDKQPPEEGAMGVLSGPGPGQQEFSVYWVKTRQVSTVAGLEFLDWFRDTKAEKVTAVECLSLSLPMLSGEPSEHPAVFAVDNNRALVWGGPSGWGWVDLAASKARVDTLEQHLETILATSRAAVRYRTSSEGWTLHNRLMLNLVLQPVRTEPQEGAPYAAQGFPDGRMVGESLWRTSTPKEFSPGSNAPPHSLEDLDVQRTPTRTRDIVVQPLERRGDWLQVAFPEPGYPTYLTDAVGLGESAENQALLVKWSAQPAGWVRLYQRGPVEGEDRDVGDDLDPLGQRRRRRVGDQELGIVEGDPLTGGDARVRTLVDPPAPLHECRAGESGGHGRECDAYLHGPGP